MEIIERRFYGLFRLPLYVELIGVIELIIADIDMLLQRQNGQRHAQHSNKNPLRHFTFPLDPLPLNYCLNNFPYINDSK